MSIRVRWLLCCALSVLLPACVESEHPLSDPLKSQQDSRLYGVWRKTNEDGTVEYLPVGREVSEPLDPGRSEPEPGVMRYWSVKQSTKSHVVENPTSAQFTCTKIGEQDFASWVSPPNPSTHKSRTYFLLKYRIDDNELAVWLQDPEATARAIEAGKLKGVVKRKKAPGASDAGSIEELRMTDSTEALVRFLGAGGAADCFPDGNKSIYSRVR